MLMKLFDKFSILRTALLLAAVSILGITASAREISAPFSPSSMGGRTISIISTEADAGTQVTVSVELDSQGDEIAASFSLSFDPTLLSNPVVTIGSTAPLGANLSVNLSQAAQGRIGILLDSTVPFQISPPNRQMLTVRFDVSASAPAAVTPITFGTVPTPISVSNIQGALLPTVYQVGTVTITPGEVMLVTIGGRVTTPSGQNFRNAIVSLIDSEGERRIATTSSFGLYSFENVATGQSYTITVTSKRYRFSPLITTITGPRSDLNFAGQE